MSAKKDMTGMRFGRLVVLHEGGRNKRGNPKWRCRCDCGNEVTVLGLSLRNGHTTSCGCFHRERASERTSARSTKHGLLAEHSRLYDSVRLHFKRIREKVSGYARWSLDPRYADDIDGIVKFCKDLIALFPDECERYERDKTLELDKDNDIDKVFRPESVVFVTRTENLNNRKCTVRLPDGTPFADFCRSVGVATFENRTPTKAYRKYIGRFKSHSCELHPELVRKANETILIYRQCIELLRLLDEAKQLRRNLNK